MSEKNKEAILDYINFNEKELYFEDIETSLQKDLKLQLSDFLVLESEKEKIGNPDSLGKVILEEIWNQFGNQIGLDMTNETLIQEYNRKHPEKYNKDIANTIMKDEKYKKANANMKKQHKEGQLKDSYTGKEITISDIPNLDHVVPRKELYDNIRRKQANIETKDLANKKENLAPTNESLNKSKKEKSNQEYINKRSEREKELIKQNKKQHEKINNSNKSEAEKNIEHKKIDKRLQDKLDADDKLMLEIDITARKAINKDIFKGVAKETAKKAGKDALKIMVITALFDLLKSIMKALVHFFKESHKTFELFLNEMKKAIQDFISHISNFIKAGISSMIGTIVSEIFGPIVSLFKKLASLIKQGISSFMDVFYYLKDSVNTNIPINIKIAQIGKIITVGLAATGAIISSELIEKILLQIPVMNIKIPHLGSIANITGMFFASLLSGILGAIVINHINRYILKQQKNKNLDDRIDKKNEILKTQNKIINIKIEKLSNLKEQTFYSMKKNREQAKEIINNTITTVLENSTDKENFEERLNNIAFELDKLLD